MRFLPASRWVSFLVATSAAAPFVGAFLCPPFALTQDFLIPADRTVCRGGAILSLVFLALAGIVSHRFLGAGSGRGEEVSPAATGSRGSRFLPGYILFSVGIPVIAFAAYLFSFTLSADRALLSADQDVTNVSTAIARTTVTDLLPSPYVAAGSSRSFLAHHFSPSLLLFVPAYRVIAFFNVDHGIYNTVLAFTILAGLGLWIYYAFRSWNNEVIFLPLILIPFTHSFLLFRQVVSFHFEVLSLPLFALLLLSLRLQKGENLPPRAALLARLWPLIALLYLGIKEDMGVYLGLYGAVFFFFDVMEDVFSKRKNSIKGPSISEIGSSLRSLMFHSVYLRLAILSALWLVLAMTLRLWIAGEGAPGWESYWNAAQYPPFRKTPYAYLLILFSSGFWILFSGRSLAVVAGILLLHIVSGMPWHALLESHYSYTILPFLLAGAVRGFSNLRGRYRSGRISGAALVILLFTGAMAADYALLRERNHPFPLLKPDPAYSAVKRMLGDLPAGACVQSSFHLSPLVPLRDRPLPFTFYRGSPWEKLFPGGCRLADFPRTGIHGECNGLYRLLLERPGGCLKQEMDETGEYLGPDEPGPVLWHLKDR